MIHMRVTHSFACVCAIFQRWRCFPADAVLPHVLQSACEHFTRMEVKTASIGKPAWCVMEQMKRCRSCDFTSVGVMRSLSATGGIAYLLQHVHENCDNARLLEHRRIASLEFVNFASPRRRSRFAVMVLRCYNCPS